MIDVTVQRNNPLQPRPGVMRVINGNIGAAAGFNLDVLFSPQGRELELDARSSLLAEKDFTFCADGFTEPAPARIPSNTNSPVT